MATFYTPVDTVLYDYLEYRNASGGVTGKVQGDFTIQLSSRTAGNVATTGITLTEIDATNNAGVYRIAADLTSFVGDVGDYELTIFDTASPQFSWGATYKVALANEFPSSIAAFTSTSANGRVTDGTNPIAGATVDLKDGSGTLITRVLTGADGNWGPVYLASTVTAYAQKSGYSQGTAQVTVSGSTATGPGADIALTAATISASLTADSLWAYAKRVSRDRTGARSDAVIKSAVNDAPICCPVTSTHSGITVKPISPYVGPTQLGRCPLLMPARPSPSLEPPYQVGRQTQAHVSSLAIASMKYRPAIVTRS